MAGEGEVGKHLKARIQELALVRLVPMEASAGELVAGDCAAVASV